MNRLKRVQVRRFRRAMRVKNSVGKGTAERPRVSVFRSLRHIYVQAVDDSAGKTIVSASSLELQKAGKLGSGLNKTEAAKTVGRELAQRLKEKGVEEAIFDRGRFKYHGRVKALCDAIREEGIRI